MVYGSCVMDDNNQILLNGSAAGDQSTSSVVLPSPACDIRSRQWTASSREKQRSQTLLSFFSWDLIGYHDNSTLEYYIRLHWKSRIKDVKLFLPPVEYPCAYTSLLIIHTTPSPLARRWNSQIHTLEKATQDLTNYTFLSRISVHEGQSTTFI